MKGGLGGICGFQGSEKPFGKLYIAFAKKFFLLIAALPDALAQAGEGTDRGGVIA
jgi:hypothetical protein